MKAFVPIVLVGLCLVVLVGLAVWVFRRSSASSTSPSQTNRVRTLEGNFWRDFPSAKGGPLPLPYGPYFPLEARGIDKVVAFDDVLGEAEMAYLRALMEEGPEEEGVFEKGANPWLKSLEIRLAKLLQKDPASLEALRIYRHGPKDRQDGPKDKKDGPKDKKDGAKHQPETSNQTSPHIDVLEDGGGRQGQRLSTMHIFLNSLPPLEDGGRTIFNKLDAAVKPKAGTAIGWNNVLMEGGQARGTDHEMWHMSQALTLDKSALYTLVVYSRERP